VSVSPKRKKAVYRAATLALPALAIALAWHFLGLSQDRSPQEIARALEQLAARRWGWAWVPLGFAAGSALFVPVNALIAGTALTFDPLRGCAFVMGGGLMGASMSYGVGWLFGSRLVDVLRRPRVDPVIERVRRSRFRTSRLLHLLPVGSFTAVNLLAGSLRVPYVGFLLGTALGLMPGMVLFVLLAQQLGSSKGVVVAVVGVLALVVAGFMLRRLVKESAQA
jgi:phospholipase D1/2